MRPDGGHRGGRPRAVAATLAMVLAGLLLGARFGPASGGSGDVGSGTSLEGTSGTSGWGASYCPSAGPVFLGVDWNCIAELDLTVILLMIGAIGIIAYIFWDSDAAELPGESEEIPLTEEEWAAVRARRDIRLGETDAVPSPPEERR